ncbi:glycoside hydrolase family 35 protein [Dothidotthia symphoricarpi CBS 119687]|uniref:Glycoside hydrolase family 35 protein n=1 Tax=Dothidotthia symphoricarpi CBS 119687 TaxID=1392245 RepID=A0A6A6AHW2_9PLEO|nr:glycoside hydrolase family 35 protein [Dothidotthia symphoricarpi CBS 119687]KAF2130497.1 glycoside hydrolase family 35 protein [Dothidotthia symphoricarpi CBS 119687]
MTATTFPHLRKTKTSSQLIVNGEPFLMLSAELHNSTLSSAKYMADDKVWQNMRAMHMNTLLGSVSWEQIEPVEGHFDFSNLDAVILAAREHGIKLVLLWFGSFKNALSTYVPAWVKKDVKRFPRVHVLEKGGKRRTEELMSPFCEEGWKADAKAFAALMAHLKEFDGQHSTVVMVQVENETGLLGDSRDRSKIAEQKFREPMPKELLQYLQANKAELHPEFQQRYSSIHDLTAGEATWMDAFGAEDSINAEEMFMADAFSRYIHHVASAGKAEYPIPLYANVWLNFDKPGDLDLVDVPVVVGGGAKAGIYPSGGPCPHTTDVYKFNAPSLDFIAPDLYFHDYETTCKNYRHGGQPLFIPEQRRDDKGARRVWLAYATYLALGCSPFGIDSHTAAESPFTKHYGLIHSLRKQILEVQAERPEDMMGFFFDDWVEGQKVSEKPWTKTIGGFEVIIERAFVFGKPGPGAGMVIYQGDGKFLCAGWGFNLSFKSTNPKSTFTGILHAEEKEVNSETCELTTLKLLGGDETRSGEFLIMPNEEPDYGGFPIAVTIPARTCIAECWAYSLEEDESDF